MTKKAAAGKVRYKGEIQMNYTKEIERLLMQVEKPASYIGGEYNSCCKDEEKVALNYGFCFPDLYEIGMSYLGLQIIYHVLNERDDIYCQRYFAPRSDMEKLMRENNIPLCSIEKQSAAADMDVLGFTLQYELSYTNILNMLDLAGIPARREDRDESYPIIVAGGNCSFNPEPLADFIDVFTPGDGEDMLITIADAIIDYKKSGKSKEELLNELAHTDGVYVPAFYEPVYGEDGILIRYDTASDDIPKTVVKSFTMDMDVLSYPLKPIVPFVDVVHDRSVIELFRGCTRGCRFCQAGMLCRPVRERSPEQILDYAREQLANTGYDEVSLLSLSTSDYSKIEPLVKDLMQMCRKQNTGLSLPSLRLDSFSYDVLKEIQTFRMTGLTFAPEAGTQRMRNIINKTITEEQIYSAARQAIELGYNNIKLYFMIGLPGERDEDLDGIAQIAANINEIYKKAPERSKKFNITVSVSNFVPKPDTPFQWVAQDTPEEFDRKHRYLKEKFRGMRGVSFQYHGTETSFLEAVLARGDRRLGAVMQRALELGCKFDGWSEFFDYQKWMQAFEDVGIKPEFYSQRVRAVDECLPWDLIDCGVSKDYMKKEYEKALSEIQTRDCRKGCTGCGIKRFVTCPEYEYGSNYS